MGFELNGTTLTGGSGLAAAYGSDQIMKMATDGTLQRSRTGQTMFRASGTYNSWWNIGTDTWGATIPGMDITDVNVGSCYNPTYCRFTAPIDGVYLFTCSLYIYIGTAGGYTHPMFWVNGDSNPRRPSPGALHRMRGHGITAGYSVDTDTMEFIPLIAGDYVEYRNYCGGVVHHLPYHGRFEGYLLT